MRKATLYVYVMTKDDGSAPNPFHGVCTLGLCMPMTRSAAQAGDYVVGLAGKCLREEVGGDWRIIYAMQVSKAMTFEKYRLCPRFRDKEDNVGHAVKGTDRVLIGEKFAYWGRKIMPVPPDLDFLVSAFSRDTHGNKPCFIGHRRKFSEEEIKAFAKWFDGLGKRGKRGILGMPTDGSSFPAAKGTGKQRKKC